MNAEPPPVIDLQVAISDDSLPTEASFRRWVTAARPPDKIQSELTIRIVGLEESRQLNAQYRDKDAPTNVLSFPADPDLPFEIAFLGDLIVCAPVVAQEAFEQNKDVDGHWAHMIVHGVLHLLGYDHIEPTEAEIMEGLETSILVGLNFSCPYEPHAEHS